MKKNLSPKYMSVRQRDRWRRDRTMLRQWVAEPTKRQNLYNFALYQPPLFAIMMGEKRLRDSLDQLA